MEFSEAYELDEMLKYSPGSRKSSNFDKKSAFSLLETMMNYGLDIDDSWVDSDFMPTEFSKKAEFATEVSESVIVEEKQQEPGPVVLQVLRDDNFKETYQQSLCKGSNLTQSLKNDIAQKQPVGRKLTVYLFATQEKLSIMIPKKATVQQVILRVISAYIKDERFRDKPIPCGPIAEAYEI